MIDWSDRELTITNAGLFDTTTGERLWSEDLERKYVAPRGVLRSSDYLTTLNNWNKWVKNHEEIVRIMRDYRTWSTIDDETATEHDIYEFCNAHRLIRKAAVTGVFPDDSASKYSDPTAEIDDFLSGIKRKETTT